jgi:hypothetical protein
MYIGTKKRLKNCSLAAWSSGIVSACVDWEFMGWEIESRQGSFNRQSVWTDLARFRSLGDFLVLGTIFCCLLLKFALFHLFIEFGHFLSKYCEFWQITSFGYKSLFSVSTFRAIFGHLVTLHAVTCTYFCFLNNSEAKQWPTRSLKHIRAGSEVALKRKDDHIGWIFTYLHMWQLFTVGTFWKIQI